MPNDVFNIATDLSIRYFNQTISAYVDVVADSFEIDIDRGVQVEQGVFASGAVGVATVKLVKKNLADFLGTPGYKAGDLFDIRYKPTPDTAPTTYNTIYSGYIQNVSMGYINESGTLEITIVANDVMRYYMNQVLTTFSVTGTVSNRSFRNCMINLNSALSTASTFSPAGTILNPIGAGASATTQLAFTWTNEPAGTILQRFLDAELGWAWGSKSSPNTVSYMARADVDTKKAVTFTTGNPTASNVHSSSANHYCLDSINLNYDSDLLVNRAVVIDSVTGVRTVASNATSISTNGLRADEFVVNLDPAGASTYATLASRIANAATLKQVYGVAVPVIRDDGKAGTIADFEIGDTLQVEFAQSGLPTLEVVSIVSRINHIITPQHWEMNIGLWRGI